MSTRLSLTGLSPSLAGFPKTVLLGSLNQFRGPNPRMHAPWFGLFRFRSPLLTESHVVFSSSGYLDVSVHRVPDVRLWIYRTTTEVCSARFPHSDTPGSMDICSSPGLFAAYHVFLRLLVPRHPPCALSSLTSLCSVYSVTPAGCVFCLFSDVLTRSFDLISDRFNMRFSRYVAVRSGFRLPAQMEMERFELLTPCLQGRCSPN